MRERIGPWVITEVLVGVPPCDDVNTRGKKWGNVFRATRDAVRGLHTGSFTLKDKALGTN
jgi:hypothetical protein